MAHWYRYEDVQYAAYPDEDGECRGVGELKVHLRRYNVIKETPKGVWLDVYSGGRFVLASARKRFACPTEEEARESFVARKKRQISIHTTAVNRANKALKILEEGGYIV